MSESNVDSYYSQLCEHLGMAVIAADLNLDIRTWNAAAARTFGAAAERMIGTPITLIVPQASRAAAEGMLRRAIETGETIQFEFQHRDAQGGRRELAATIAPVLSVLGRRTGVSICVRDITQRIALEDKLLENRKMVALGEMAGAIAHHFNNILGGVVTSIDFATASGDEGMKDRVLNQAVEALQRATTLVSGLAAFAEGDRRADDSSDLREIIKGISRETEQSIKGRGIDFAVNLSELPVIPVAKTQLTTILQKIIENAIEAMPDGGKLRIDVSADNQRVTIVISDTGRGLDEVARSRVFEPFWTTKPAPGVGPGHAAGLGLAIAHGLIHMMGGTITVTSQVGRGTSFSVALPIPDAC
jgi:PAS domain S-box-containing protein